MMARSRLAAGSLTLLCVVCLTVGCTSTPTAEEINARLTSLEVVSKKPPDATYVVDPPDAIALEFIGDEGLSRTVRLRQDGVVTLPYLEDVKVAGMTTKEIGEKLEKLYGEYYKSPQILVTVASYASKHITVYGEVRRVGTQPYTGSVTVADAVGAAGGVTRRSAPGRVKVIRGDPEDPEIFGVDLKSIIYKGRTELDVSLAENDIVYVPPSVLAWVGYQIEALLFPFRSILNLGSTTESLQVMGGVPPVL